MTDTARHAAPEPQANAAPAVIHRDVVVVGAGAAGLMTAIAARRRWPGLTVTVLEGAERLGRKILISGPVVLDASRHWHRAELDGLAPSVHVRLRQGRTFEQVEDDLLAALRARPRASTEAIVRDWLPASVAAHLLAAAGIDRTTPCRNSPATAAAPSPTRSPRGGWT